MIALLALLLPLSTEGTHESPGAMPYIVGAVALGILLAMLFALLAFGKGREHS